MKTIFAFLTALISISTLANAQALSQKTEILDRMAPLFGASITKAHVDPNLNLGPVTGGRYSVNLEQNYLSLSLEQAFRCPPDAFCILSMLPNFEVTLPIVEIKHTSCGSVMYIAQRDARPVDGALERLEIVDHSGNRCRMLVPSSEAHYSTAVVSRSNAGETIETHSSFQGSPLLPLPRPTTRAIEM